MNKMAFSPGTIRAIYILAAIMQLSSLGPACQNMNRIKSSIIISSLKLTLKKNIMMSSPF